MDSNFEPIAHRIQQHAAVKLQPARPRDLRRVRRLPFPEKVRAFFESHEPSDCAEINRVRLWPLRALLEENTKFVPGADLNPRGYLVIGTTEFGDAYCLDFNADGENPPVVLFSHEEAWEEVSDSDLQRLRKVVARSFNEFLELFAAGTLDQTPLL